MFKLMIVDDESSVRSGLRDCVEWERYGIEVVGEANNGETALELSIKLKPDLVITDVRMPIMDGITLSYELISRFPRIKIVFVSGYDDVDYLKSAMKINAIDYIFKPVNLNELNSVLTRITGRLQSELDQHHKIRVMQDKLVESMPVLREKFVLSLLRDRPQNIGRLQEKLKFLELDWPVEANYWVMIIDIDDKPERFEPLPERDKQLMSYALLNICQELIDSHLHGYTLENGSGEFVAILWKHDVADEAELLFKLAQEFRDNLERWLKFSVTVGIGERADGPAGLQRSYSLAREAVGQRWYLGKNRIITMNGKETPADAAFRFDVAAAESFEAVLRMGDPLELDTYLEGVFGETGHRRTHRFKFGLNVAFQLLLASSRVALELGIWNDKLEEEESAMWELLLGQQTLHDVRSCLHEYLVRLVRIIADKQKGRSSYMIERIKALIEKNFADNLTVADIAKEVFLNPTYMCMLFKQETGSTILEHITAVRMEQAKRLLAEPGSKFYDISLAVGYADPSYFSKQFKKYTGYSPSVYRDSFL